MSAILVLLVLLSLATLASRRGFAMFVAHIIATPLLLAVGYAIAPQNLSLLSEAALRDLEPAMQVGASWLALLVGMRGARPTLSKKYVGYATFAAITAILTWGGVTVVAWGSLSLLGMSNQGLHDLGGALPVLGASLLCAGLISTTGLALTSEALQGERPSVAHDLLRFLCRHDEAIGAIALLVAMWLWPRPISLSPIYEEPLIAAIVVVVLAALLALIQVLLGEDRDKLIGRVALVGLITLSAGMTSTMGVPGVALGFFFGVVLGLTGVAGPMLEDGLANTYRPVRLVLVVLIGANLGFTIGAVLLGGALVAARILFKVVLRGYLSSRFPTTELPLSAVLASGGTTIPFALSFAMSQPGPLNTSEVLAAIAIAVGITDLVTLVAWRKDAWKTDANAPKAKVRIASVTTMPSPPSSSVATSSKSSGQTRSTAAASRRSAAPPKKKPAERKMSISATSIKAVKITEKTNAQTSKNNDDDVTGTKNDRKVNVSSSKETS